LSAIANANLVVLGPSEIIDEFPNESKSAAFINITTIEHMISANYANFGHIPYGQSIIG